MLMLLVTTRHKSNNMKIPMGILIEPIAIVFLSFKAFAAILGDGSVVTWGSVVCGGNSSAVRDQLSYG